MATEYTNKVQFPDTYREACGDSTLGYCGVNVRDDYVFYGYRIGSQDHSIQLCFISPSSSNPNTNQTVAYIVYSLDDAGHLLDVVSSTSVNSVNPYYLFTRPDVQPFYYGVTSTLVPESVVISATLLAIAFFTLIYKMIKRVLF